MKRFREARGQPGRSRSCWARREHLPRARTSPAASGTREEMPDGTTGHRKRQHRSPSPNGHAWRNKSHCQYCILGWVGAEKPRINTVGKEGGSTKTRDVRWVKPQGWQLTGGIS